MKGLICVIGAFVALAAADLGAAKRPLPSLSVGSTQAEEAGAATFVVRLSKQSRTPVQVRYATSDGTATAGSDYRSASGTLKFRPGERAKRISVPVLDDPTPEDEETLYLTLSRPKNARITVQEGQAKIAANDLPPPFTARTTLVSAGGGGSGEATLTLDAAAETAAFTLKVTGSPEDPSAGHIHSARDQSLGIVLLPLPTRNGSASGTVHVPRKVILGIYTAPNDYDLQIHTPTAAYTLDGRLART
jgi:Calx-beta domain-containing protein/CHRD domain-containing protein